MRRSPNPLYNELKLRLIEQKSRVGSLQDKASTVRKEAEGIDGEVKSAGDVRLDGGKDGKMVFRARPTHQNQAIGRDTDCVIVFG